MSDALKSLEKYKVPIAVIGVFGSIAGLFISLFDLKSALKKKKK